MEIQIGEVTHYFTKLSVAVVRLTGELSIGDTIVILGHTTDLTQKASSLEIEHQKIVSAGPGMEVALRVADVVRRGDVVFKIPEKDPGTDSHLLWELAEEAQP